GLARELGEKKGYTTAFFHGAQNNSMGFQAFARATGFQRYYGRTEYNQDPRYHGDDDFDGTSNDIYKCEIYYGQGNETELLINILSFGPMVKVIGSERFLKQLKERLKKQRYRSV
ncbi:MAG: hypothetical protein IKH94_05195, partial [Eubacterium sp.]|nr:hypothetical protein [Eubacterium sp.]